MRGNRGMGELSIQEKNVLLEHRGDPLLSASESLDSAQTENIVLLDCLDGFSFDIGKHHPRTISDLTEYPSGFLIDDPNNLHVHSVNIHLAFRTKLVSDLTNQNASLVDQRVIDALLYHLVEVYSFEVAFYHGVVRKDLEAFWVRDLSALLVGEELAVSHLEDSSGFH